MPEALRRASAADPAARAEINRVWSQLQNYVGLGPAQELKALKEKFPGGVAEAEAIINDAISIQDVDAKFYGGTPEQRAELAANLFKDSPQDLIATAEATMQFLAKNAPQDYQRITDSVLGQAIAQGELGGYLQMLEDAALKGDTNLAKMVQDVVDKAREMAGFKKPATNPEQAALDRRKAELDARDQNFNAEKLTSFQGKFNDQVPNQVGTEALAIINPLVEGVPVAAGFKDRLVGQIVDKVEEVLKQDRTLQYQLNQLDSLKRYDDATLKQRVDLTVNRAKVVLPDIARNLFSEWTAHLVSSNNATLEKKTAAAGRKDIVGGGASSERRPHTPKPGEVDYSKTSDQDILDGNIKTKR